MDKQDAPLLCRPVKTAPSRLAEHRPRLLSPGRLKGLKAAYDVIVIGSGLAGLTAANRLARAGHQVLLLEQHQKLGGLATWFKRGDHCFDVSLHGFPVGMKKTCRKYWSKDIADRIIKLKRIRFDNPEFTLETTFTREDFSRLLVSHFQVDPKTVEAFFTRLAEMNFYDDQGQSTGELFESFFPGRRDIARFLMEPIAYANGSTLADPAITYGIVFSNFMSQGVYTFQGGTDLLIAMMKAELQKSGVDIRCYAEAQGLLAEHGRISGVVVNGQTIAAKSVLSNANLRTTVNTLGQGLNWKADYLERIAAMRMNSSSVQVYLGIAEGETIDDIGDLFFTSTAPHLDSTALTALDCTSRTYSFYYPWMRPERPRTAIVASMNANYADWAAMDKVCYEATKERYARETLSQLEGYLPGVTAKIDHVEVATPTTFGFFARHEAASSFGTKFEGLKLSQELPKVCPGLFHAGSVGIIMSGWLGAANYGVIVANEVDRYLSQQES